MTRCVNSCMQYICMRPFLFNKDVKVNKTKVTMYVGKTYKLTAKYGTKKAGTTGTTTGGTTSGTSSITINGQVVEEYYKSWNKLVSFMNEREQKCSLLSFRKEKSVALMVDNDIIWVSNDTKGEGNWTE